MWRANLTRAEVPDVIVSTVGPSTGDLGFHPANVEVIAWDSLARRWSVVFNAQKVVAPAAFSETRTSNAGPAHYAGYAGESVPLLDPKADVTVDRVVFAPMLAGVRRQLIFSATSSYGGSGLPGTLAIVDFRGGQANVLYTWSADHGIRWRFEDGVIHGRADYWTPADAHCCPLREYSFTIGRDGNSIDELSDQRPYLGVLVRQTEGAAGVSGPLEVIEVAEGSPAEGSLDIGDVIVDVQNGRPPHTADAAASDSVYDKLSSLDSGDEAQLVVERDGRASVVRVKLGSLRDAGSLYIPNDTFDVGGL
jgi:hypothetical protein